MLLEYKTIAGFILHFAFYFKSYEAADGCSQSLNAAPGTYYLSNPGYPNNAVGAMSCLYRISAPPEYHVRSTCKLELAVSTNCREDSFYISTDGDPQLKGSERLCGCGTFERTSDLNEMSFGFILNRNSRGGRFLCTLIVERQPCNCGRSSQERIVNGQNAEINEYPSMAALKYKTNPIKSMSFCGATIIARRFLITAAHCVHNVEAKDLVAQVGVNNLKDESNSAYSRTYDISDIIIHPKYDAHANQNDIALLQTSKDIMWTKGVGAICLPRPRDTCNTFTGEKVDVIGYGSKFFAGPASNTLQKVTVNVASNAFCSQTFQEENITQSHICTFDQTQNHRDSCQQDSGGPVIKRTPRQYLLGTISFGDICGRGSKYAMSVNTRITTYLQWIYENLGFFPCVPEYD